MVLHHLREQDRVGTLDLGAWTSGPSFGKLLQHLENLDHIPTPRKNPIETRWLPSLIFDLSKYHSYIWQIEAKRSDQSPFYGGIVLISLISSLELLFQYVVCP